MPVFAQISLAGKSFECSRSLSIDEKVKSILTFSAVEFARRRLRVSPREMLCASNRPLSFKWKLALKKLNEMKILP